MSTVTSPGVLDSTGQSIATAISSMSATSVGNLAALTTTDKTSLVAAINELKSGLTNLKNFVNCVDAIGFESGVTIAGKTLYTNGSVLYGSIVLDISQLSGSIVGHTESGYRPIAMFRTVAVSYATSTDAGSSSFITFETNGDINIEHTDGKPYLVFNFAYPLAN